MAFDLAVSGGEEGEGEELQGLLFDLCERLVRFIDLSPLFLAFQAREQVLEGGLSGFWAFADVDGDDLLADSHLAIVVSVSVS